MHFARNVFSHTPSRHKAACLEDALGVLALPEKYRRRLKSTDMLERLIRVFPNEASAHRLMGALLAEIHEQWQERRYLDMSDFHECWETQKPSDRKEDKVVGIDH